ncbi:GIY-YIG nuclease family protein [Vibrio sp. S11_S32]|uniref:GIY-YIG nuclease family protein n=2 Tax=Vibrionaceae TaxID=641 RepID=A0A5Q0TJE0_9VIBR|nr:GIY-YIG nuclease family protein [Vibrio sp. S11_S32]
MTDVTVTPHKQWHVYLIRTRANSLYCGITNDLARRFAQHQLGKGAKYLRGKGPLELVWSQSVDDKSAALKEEIRIKKLSKAYKERLVLEG